ncbi:MAG: LysR family transcriptional regulator [Parvibaculaceae bacterium]
MIEEPRLSLKLVEAFRHIMAAGSLSAAARALGTSQPQMTRLLHGLERETQLVLFLRHRRGITPTREAELLYEEINRAFLGLRDISRAAREIRDFARGAISIATNPAGAFELIPSAVAAFARSYRDVRISVQVQASHQTMDGVRNGRVDLGLISPLESVTGVTVVARWHMPYVVVLRADDARGQGRRMMDISDFEPQSLVVPDATYLAARCASAAAAPGSRRWRG